MAICPPLSIGIVGGMSPESTATYYRHIIRRHRSVHHNHAYPRIVLVSVSFQQYIDWQHAGEWDRIAQELQKEFEAVAAAGADFGLLAANTMHKVLPGIKSPIPVLSILDVVSQEAKRLGMTTLGLTGTSFVMADGFYEQALRERGVNVVLPTPEDQETIHRIIYEELIFGTISEQAEQDFARIAQDLMRRGAEAILLACTELELLTRRGTLTMPTLDTARLHAEYAYRQAESGLLPPS